MKLTVVVIQVASMTMNLKHEMFWNRVMELEKIAGNIMNLKHEMFWNKCQQKLTRLSNKWTLNMKCFEIFLRQ